MAKQSIEAEDLASEAWRANIDTYAAHISDGEWKPFPWIVHVLEVVQHEIAKGGARIIIEAPPRHGKSESISHWLPTHYLDWNPTKRVILASYGDEFSKKWGKKVRDEFQREWRETRTEVAHDKSSAREWLTTEGGGMKSTGISGSITGEGGDLIILDDLHKDWAEAQSPTKRKNVIDWFEGTLYTRLEPGASIVLIMTRWNEADIVGHLINNHSDNWLRIRPPALAEESDPLGRAEGEALCPERYDVVAINKIKAGMHSMKFAALFQQRPAPPEGNIVKRNDIMRYTRLPDDLYDYLVSWDLTFKESGTSWVVGQVWARDRKNPAHKYLIDQKRKRMSFRDTKRSVLAFSLKYPDAVNLVEDAANGQAILSDLKGIVNKLKIIPTKGKSKIERFVLVADDIETHDVFFPSDEIASWMPEFVERLVAFPNARFDDEVDALSQALERFKNTKKKHVRFTIPDVGLEGDHWSNI